MRILRGIGSTALSAAAPYLVAVLLALLLGAWLWHKAQVSAAYKRGAAQWQAAAKICEERHSETKRSLQDARNEIRRSNEAARELAEQARKAQEAADRALRAVADRDRNLAGVVARLNDAAKRQGTGLGCESLPEVKEIWR